MLHLRESLSVLSTVCPDLQDDAPLPLAQYTGMSDILRPSRDPQTFDAWMAEMQQKLQQRLRQCQGGKCAYVTGPAVSLQGS